MSGSDPALVLVGPMGAGKTSIGRRVARALGLVFRDTDAMIVDEHGPIPEMFATHGEDYFRAAERQAVRTALAAGGVVSLGGGAIVDPGTRADLAAHRVVFLTVQPRVVAGRLGGRSRPLLEGDDPLQQWRRILRERAPWYEEVADLTIDTSTGPLSRVADAVTDWWRNPPERENA